ncbi:MAG TPA: CbiM family transporter [Gemmataceae bacterium]|nr:CbiM family transporter [Gemmataceae bacterium]
MGLSLLAVHLSDGAIATSWWAAGFGGAAILLLPAWWRLTEDEIPRIGVLTAAFFVASSIHFKLGVTSVHLILNGLVGVVLGRRAPLAITVGLVLQYLLVAHGGYTTLGLNACIIGLPAIIAGWLFPILRRAGVPAFAAGCVLGVFAAGGAVGLNFLVLLLGGKDDFETLAKLVLLAHIPVVIVEGLMLGVIVQYLEKVKPELLGVPRPKPPDEDLSW